MWIRVEKTIHQDHLEKDLAALPGDSFEIESRRPKPFQVIDADPINEFHHQYSLRAEMLKDIGNVYIAAALEVGPKASRVLRFPNKIHLLVDRLVELFHLTSGVEKGEVGDVTLDQSGQSVEKVPVP